MLKITAAVRKEIRDKFPNIAKFDVSMKEHSQWKIGGRIAAVICPTSKAEISELLSWCASNDLPYFIIGGTTNLLFCDENIDAIGIHIGTQFSNYTITDNRIVADAGLWMPKLAKIAMDAGLSGIEHTCGIPGTLGGLVVMNGGSQRKNIGDNIVYVKTIDVAGITKTYSKQECLFGYRSSVFQQRNETIIEAGLQLEPIINKQAMHSEMLSILRSRSKKFPRKMPNCGSVFQSRGEIYSQFGPPGQIIEECGLKGLIKGGAQVSSAHANFIVNNNGATAEDILYLIKYLRNKVHEEKGCFLKVETKFVSKRGCVLEVPL